MYETHIHCELEMNYQEASDKWQLAFWDNFQSSRIMLAHRAQKYKQGMKL